MEILEDPEVGIWKAHEEENCREDQPYVIGFPDRTECFVNKQPGNHATSPSGQAMPEAGSEFRTGGEAVECQDCSDQPCEGGW